VSRNETKKLNRTPKSNSTALAILAIFLLTLLSCHGSDSKPEVEGPAKLIYDEFTDGDMDFTYFPNLGLLDNGRYQIVGRVNWIGCPALSMNPCIEDLDALFFEIPPGSMLDVEVQANIELDMPESQSNNIMLLDTMWELNLVEVHWDASTVGIWTGRAISDLSQLGNNGNFFQTPTWALTYAGPNLLDDERIIMHYSILLDIHPTPLHSNQALQSDAALPPRR
jgi:hypothetical protein